jgi:hypothetical protein
VPELIFPAFVVSTDPLAARPETCDAKTAEQVGVPFAAMPVVYLPVTHGDGVEARAVAVAAFPVVLDVIDGARRAAEIVPVVILSPLVVSIVAEAERPLISDAEGCAKSNVPLLANPVANACVTGVVALTETSTCPASFCVS